MTIFPRHGHSDDSEANEKARAHRILDRAKLGEAIHSKLIDWALSRTGDLIEQPKEEMTC
jgi:hypothetical protein